MILIPARGADYVSALDVLQAFAGGAEFREETTHAPVTVIDVEEFALSQVSVRYSTLTRTAALERNLDGHWGLR